MTCSLRHKSGSDGAIFQALAFILTQFNRKVKSIRLDNETALTSDIFISKINRLVIQLLPSAPHTQAQNGRSERVGGEIIRRARAMSIQNDNPSINVGLAIADEHESSKKSDTSLTSILPIGSDNESRHIPMSEELQTVNITVSHESDSQEHAEMILNQEKSLSQENAIRKIPQRIASRAGKVSADLIEEHILPELLRRPLKAPRRDLYSSAGNYEAFFTAITATVTDPELIGRKLPFTGFIEAAELELKTLISKDTFAIIPSKDANKLEREHEIKSLPLKWVFTYKQDKEARHVKYKARICVRGDLYRSTRYTFAATLAVRTFRALISMLAEFDLEIVSLDASIAFLNSKLDEVVICDLLPGHEVEDKKILLKRALYGLPRSPLLWAQLVEKELGQLGFEKVSGVDCLMYDRITYFFYFVDEFLAISLPQHKSQLQEFKVQLMKTFQMREVEPDRFLGIRIIMNRLERKVWILQDIYFANIAAKYYLDLVTRVTILLPITYGKYPESSQQNQQLSASPRLIHEYQQKVGSIGHAAMFTRPDVAKSYSLLAESLSNPTHHDLKCADQCIQYLYSTRYLAILYHGSNGDVEVFDGASDAAFVDDIKIRKSLEAYLFRLFGGAIAWAAKKQPKVAKSTMEYELAALSRAGVHHKWWERFFRSVHFNPEQNTVIIL
ncbi:hypothetical protein K3495_g9173 [Podosphaera aphanis]|nr:hypothetical protein K3495_g9173 [Podosphaera aphanis]